MKEKFKNGGKQRAMDWIVRRLLVEFFSLKYKEWKPACIK